MRKEVPTEPIVEWFLTRTSRLRLRIVCWCSVVDRWGQVLERLPEWHPSPDWNGFVIEWHRLFCASGDIGRLQNWPLMRRKGRAVREGPPQLSLLSWLKIEYKQTQNVCVIITHHIPCIIFTSGINSSDRSNSMPKVNLVLRTVCCLLAPIICFQVPTLRHLNTYL